MTKFSVLCVDDDPGLLEITKRFLELSGSFEITTMADAGAALAALKVHSYDAIVSDYQMPAMDGIEFLKNVRKDHDGIPFILFTGRGREDIVVEALNNGADSYIQKGGNPKAQFTELKHKILSHVARRQAQTALRESEKKYRQVVDNAHEGIFVLQDQQFSFYNPRFVEMITACGFSEREFFQHSIFTFIHPEDRQCMSERYTRRIEHGESFSRYPFRFVNTTGEIFWWEIYAVVIDWDGRPATLNFARNINDNYTLQEKLSETEYRYKELFELLPKTVLEMNAQFAVTFINRVGEKKFGYHNNELDGNLSLTDLILPADRVRIQNLLSTAGTGKQLFEHETIALTREGATFPMKIYLSSVTRKKTITGFLAVCVDISEFKEAAKIQSYTNKKLSLMGNISCHDLRNKLVVLSGYLEIAKRKTTDPETLGYLQKSGDVADTIRTQTVFIEQYMKIGSCAPVWQNIEDIVNRIRPTLTEGVEDLRISVDLAGLEVYADLLLEKVLYNLFDNSLRHGEHVTEIRIYFIKSDRDLDLVYEDNGIGIPDPEKAQIFSCGYGKNTGLGLFVIEEILSSGGISITETGEQGHGARFVMHIPEKQFRFNSLCR